MKVSYLATPNAKGQVVIPKALRDALNISTDTTLNILPASRGLYMYPVSHVVTTVEAEDTFISLLKSTQGSWGKASQQEKHKEDERRKLELAATKRRKQSW